MLVVEVGAIISEELVPGTVNSVAIGPSVSDIKCIVIITFASDSSRCVVKVELLGWS